MKEPLSRPLNRRPPVTEASLYLLVLSVNSIIGIHRGFAKAPGEVPIWGTLAVFTTAVTLLLLANIRSARGDVPTAGAIER